MIVTCNSCGTQYTIDSAKMQSSQAKFKCKKCSSVIEVVKSSETDDLLLGRSTSVDDGRNESVDDLLMGSQITAPAQISAGKSSRKNTTQNVPSSSKPKKKKGFKLAWKIMLLMLLVSMAPLFVYAVSSYRQNHAQLVSDKTEYARMATNLLAMNIDEWIDKNIKAMTIVSSELAQTMHSPQEQQKVLKSLEMSFPWMYLTFSTNQQGFNAARSDDGVLADYSDRQYVKDILNGAPFSWQTLIGKTSNQPSLVLAVPIKEKDAVVGVLAAAMTRESISRIVTTYKPGATGSSFLVDETGKIVAHANPDFVQEEKDLAKHPLVLAAHNNNSTLVAFQDENGANLLGFSHKTQMGWVVAIQQDKDEAYAVLDKQNLLAALLFVISVVVVLLFTYLASRFFVRPIIKVTEAADKISMGLLDVEIKKSSNDEIGDLADAVGRMQESLRFSLNRLNRER